MWLPRRWWQNLQVRINLLFAVVILAILVVVFSLMTGFARDILVERDRRLVAQAGELIVAELNRRVEHAESLVRAMVSIVAALPPEPDHLRQTLHRLLSDSRYQTLIAGGGIWPEPGRLLPGIERASLFWGRQGNGALVQFDNYNQPDVPGYHRAEWYQPATRLHNQVCYWSRSYTDPYTGVSMVTCSAPIIRYGALWGVATVDLRLHGLDRFLAGRLASLGGYALMLDRNGRFLSLPAPMREQLGGDASSDYSLGRLEAEQTAFAPLMALIDLPPGSLSDEEQRLADSLADSTDALEVGEAERIAAHLYRSASKPAFRNGALEDDPLLDEEVQVSLVAMPRTDWLLAMVVPDRIAIAGAEQIVWRTLLVLGGTILLGMAFVVFRLQKQLVSPLQGMISQLKSSGSQPALLDESCVAELGELAGAYNRQQQQLQSYRADVEVSRQRLQTIMDVASDGILTLDRHGRLISANPAALEMLGSDELLQQKIYFPARAQDPSRSELEETLQQLLSNRIDRVTQLEVQLNQQDGSELPAELSMSRWMAGDQPHVTVFMRDISRRKAAAERIHYMATHDGLTGLHNRFQLVERLQQALEAARRHNQLVAVLFIDLDYFKEVNDSLGHQAGDQLLVGVARRLEEHRRATDTVARLGGDEFAVIIQEVEHIGAVAAIADSIVQTLQRPFTVGANECRIGASIGIALYPDNAASAPELIKQADVAMYQAKADGRNTWRFFARKLHRQQQKRRRMMAELEHAVERQQLRLLYQPIVAADTGVEIAFEALLRWQHPKMGSISPQEFIPLAEQSGLIINIGRWVLEEGCRQLQRWQNQGIKIDCLSINVSALQLQRSEFHSDLAEILADSGQQLSHLRLEITESLLIDEGCARELHRLDEMGAQLVVDDFGTGYSSLSYLQSFPVRLIKLDRSFVSEVDSSENCRLICQAVIALAHTLDMQVVAEGIENESQYRQLQQMGCDLLQGYLFSKPMTTEQTAHWVTERHHPARH
ncbi:bifunctional diguanylate cyclase/phosphodiesterase [Marinobacterium arenosum]|uniref:bifunctional diguanylate cyclase/phosphodiesterase n=1 Tax=Marinobacterium arenosum TaxID=2862496 RepID=UPI001C95939F|nr:EAL domain-containing protein [Marinobacterium arenosum]MBY4675560.1 EAL domain-containing protein [Marinobacterium arenosum]